LFHGAVGVGSPGGHVPEPAGPRRHSLWSGRVRRLALAEFLGDVADAVRSAGAAASCGVLGSAACVPDHDATERFGWRVHESTEAELFWVSVSLNWLRPLLTCYPAFCRGRSGVL